MTPVSEFEEELIKSELTGYITRLSEWLVAMEDIYVTNQPMLSIDNMRQACKRFDQIERVVFEGSEQTDQ